ncbi:hypothetical protein JTE90_015327 [Oedothorax gibbosus]|uniref:SCP domain-containing protein n=1 Tax=Oedothorax gibbosus TaxID=931172 RepID=A0AAV6TJ76_9ARAC|nr:hypothetical protein JTE90_015327 [Oedothorax gibbosus]
MDDTSTSGGEGEEDNDFCFLPCPKNPSLDVEDFRRRLVLAHNGYRKLHGAPNLSHLQELEDAAQMWADTIAARGIKLYCEKLYNTGENLCSIDIINSVPSAEGIVHNWYKEIKNYSFANPDGDAAPFTSARCYGALAPTSASVLPLCPDSPDYLWWCDTTQGAIPTCPESSRETSCRGCPREVRRLWTTPRRSSGLIQDRGVWFLRMPTYK